MNNIANSLRTKLHEMEREAAAKYAVSDALNAAAGKYRELAYAFVSKLPILDATWPQTLEYDLDRVSQICSLSMNPIIGQEVMRTRDIIMAKYGQFYKCDFTKPYYARVFVESDIVQWVDIDYTGYIPSYEGNPLMRWNGKWLGPKGIMIDMFERTTYQLIGSKLHERLVIYYNPPAAPPVDAVVSDDTVAPVDAVVSDDAAVHDDKRVKADECSLKRKG